MDDDEGGKKASVVPGWRGAYVTHTQCTSLPGGTVCFLSV